METVNYSEQYRTLRVDTLGLLYAEYVVCGGNGSISTFIKEKWESLGEAEKDLWDYEISKFSGGILS